MSSDQGEKGGADITIISHRFVGEVDKIYALLYATINDGFGKESACNAGDLSSIPGSGRYAGEGIGYPLQYSWASLVAQLVKNPPAMQETWV